MKYLYLLLVILIAANPVLSYATEENKARNSLEIKGGYHFLPKSPYFDSINNILPGVGTASDYNSPSVIADVSIKVFHYCDLGLSFRFLNYHKQKFIYDGYEATHKIHTLATGAFIRLYLDPSRNYYLSAGPLYFALRREIEGILGSQEDMPYQFGGFVSFGRQWHLNKNFSLMLEYSFHHVTFDSPNGILKPTGNVIAFGISFDPRLLDKPAK